MSFWKNKVVVITGSSIGIGRTTAEIAASNGAHVVLNARNEERLQKVVSEFQQKGYSVIGCAGDVSNYEDANRLIQTSLNTFEKVDVVINNAGVSHESKFDTLKPEVFQSVLNVNVIGCSNVAYACKEALKKSGGSLIFIGSVAGFYGMGNYSAYCTSKMAITALAQSLQIEWKNEGIHVGIAYLGLTQNDPEKVIYDADGKKVAQPKRNVKQQPVEDVANGILSIAENRKPQKVFTLLGNISFGMTRIFPRISKLVLGRIYSKSGE